MAEKEVKLRKDGLPKQPLNLFEKIVIVISVILVLLTAVTATAKWGFAKIELKNYISADVKEKPQIDKKTLKLINKFMPESIELENGDGIKFDVRLEVNEDFDSKNASSLMDYLNLFNLYDWEGNKIENDQPIQKYNILGQQLKIMAVMKIADKLAGIKSFVNNALIVLILLDIVAAIFITYFIWRRADDRRELRELQMREAEMKRVKGLSEEEIQEKKKSGKKKKKKK